MSYRPQLVIAQDPAMLARHLAAACFQVVRDTPRAPVTIALAGGSTPRRLYETLAHPAWAGGVAWERVEIFFGDERAVPAEHPESNYGMARTALLRHVAARAHPMPALEGDPGAYERLIRERVPAAGDGTPAFDLILLGVGRDGHTASLFPGTAALDEHERLVVMNDAPPPGTRRMTFTFPLIEAARRVWVVTSGPEKREIVSRCLDAASEEEYPVLRARPREGHWVWWIDRDAAP